MNRSTKQKIIEAALDSFINKGFAGASISQIAKKAAINQSLIYHHFDSKADLWLEVKRFCIDEATQDISVIRQDSLEHFIDDLISVRLSVYKRPSMQMIIHWQALESDKKSMGFGENFSHPLFDIADHIKTLQLNKLIRVDYSYQVLSSMIFSLSSYAFFDYAEVFNLNEEDFISYKALVIETLINQLKPV